MTDLHGMLDLFLAMLEKIRFGPNDTLYILGDVIDRGPHPVQILRFIMKRLNIKLILGNHEAMLLHYLHHQTPDNFQLWARNGGRITAGQLMALSKEEQDAIYTYLEERPFYAYEDNFLLVHAGITPVPGAITPEEVLRMQTQDTLLWAREEFYMEAAQSGMTTIFGHTPTVHLFGEVDQTKPVPFPIWHDPKHGDKIGLDCGAAYSEHGGRLACLCLDTMEEFYVSAKDRKAA